MECVYCGEKLWNNDDATEHAGICPGMMVEPSCLLCGDTGRSAPTLQNPDGEICQCVVSAQQHVAAEKTICTICGNPLGPDHACLPSNYTKPFFG